MRASFHHAGLIAAAFTSIALVAPAQAQDDAKAQFQARYGELRTAMEAHDAAALGKIMASDYTMTDVQGGTHSAAEVMERMTRMAGKSPDPSRKVETKVLSAVVTGDAATVEQQLVGGGKRAGDDGVEHSMEMVMNATDSWAKRGDAWVLVKSVQTGMTVKRDGEVFFQQGK
ncbi:nuclear transport factor 2 family protein [Novosphingobium aquiterrae]|uniref:Nuclear transport factor 2 family protein n=1 Tax=Novosphingobium aquiterrae TaxID=624388 RepID=A0ABV6PGL2_9SPHN